MQVKHLEKGQAHNNYEINISYYVNHLMTKVELLSLILVIKLKRCNTAMEYKCYHVLPYSLKNLSIVNQLLSDPKYFMCLSRTLIILFPLTCPATRIVNLSDPHNLKSFIVTK